MGRPRHAAAPARQPPRVRPRRPSTILVPVAAVLALATSLALVLPTLARAGQPVAAAAHPALPAVAQPALLAASPVPDVPSADPLAGVDWAADAAIRAAVVEQQVERRAAARAAARAERRAGHRSPAAAPPPAPATAVHTGSDAPVWVVGDSIGSGLGAAWSGAARVIADPGARTAVIVPQLLSALRATGAAPSLVVAAGTNDDPRDPAGFAAAVRTVLRSTPGCVVWVTIHRPGGRWEPLNALLRAEQARSGGRLQLADWDRLASANPSLLQSDGIHPRTGTVYASIAALARAAIGRCT